ncbi:MAG: UDP-N-acetylmuramate dehydrogenase [Synergistes sp.]|nr:UDP-N-acetylmuramate dehydrogenase [Synergistes sp.]
MTERISDVSLKELNTWHCGGKCLWFAAPADSTQVSDALKAAHDEGIDVYALGGGSNILVQDGTVNAAVVSSSAMSSMNVCESDGKVIIEAGAGLPVKKLLELSVKHGIGGFEFLVGIPGTVGGAVFGNAGAAGVSFANTLKWVETVSYNGTCRRWESSELAWCYRKSPWNEKDDKPFFITKAGFVSETADRKTITQNVRRFAELKKGQPIGARSAGCVFKNPEKYAAGALLDRCGCKGLAVGGARVSAKHANFIENYNEATSDDIYRLCEMCRERVFDEFGVRLEYEIKFFGAF